jgi:hypothetical protein
MRLHDFGTGRILIALLIGSASAAMAAHYIVRPDGSGDFPTIQAAVDHAWDGDVVELTDGVFTGAGNDSVRYFGKAITIRGQSGVPKGCIVDPDGAAFIFDGGEGPASRLEHLTVRTGYVTIDSANPTVSDCEFDVAGIDINAASPTVEQCYFHGAQGMAVRDSVSAPTIADCRFLDCYVPALVGGGGMASWHASPTLLRCTFRGDTAGVWGGAAWFLGGAPTIRYCTFSGNRTGVPGGGGAIWWDTREGSIQHCTLT